jgi:hypothetical protein
VNFLSLIPLLSYPLLLWSARGHWKSASIGSVAIGVLFFLVADRTGLPGIGPLYLVLFLATAPANFTVSPYASSVISAC